MAKKVQLPKYTENFTSYKMNTRLNYSIEFRTKEKTLICGNQHLSLKILIG